jgi:hypothetical protein
VIAAVTVLEHGRLQPGDVARALRQWEAAALRGEVHRPGSEPCGVAECCGPGPRDVLVEAIRGLPRRARPALRQMVGQVDATSLSPGRTVAADGSDGVHLDAAGWPARLGCRMG